MDEDRIKKLDKYTQKLFRNAHPFCEEINHFFPKYKPPEVIQNNTSIVESNQTVKEWNRAFSMQTFSIFKKKTNKKLYIQPIGPFPSQNGADEVFNNLFKIIADYLRIFLHGFNVEILEIIDHRNLNVKTRINSVTKQRQLYLPDMMQSLVDLRPKNGFCVLGISWFDFYPSENENHILGEGSFQKGVAACSFGHYSLHKEREHIQKEFWKQDYVVEPPIEIQGCQSLDGTEEKDSTFIYITQNEKEEAKMKLPDVESPCKSLEIPHSSPRMNRIKNRFSMIRSIPQALINSIFVSDSITSGVTDLSMTGIENGFVHDHDHNDDDDVFHDFEIIDHDRDHHNISDKFGETDFLKCSIPIDCKFNLNCKVFRRLLRGAAHEICHVIGLRHCQYFSCVMNASPSVILSDRQPIILCPICLRKIHIFLNFDLLERYARLSEFLEDHVNYCYHVTQSNPADTSISLADDLTCKFRDDRLTIDAVMEFMKR